MTKTVIVSLTGAEKASRLQALLGTWAQDAEPPTGADRTRARILEAATKQFQKHGYRKASVDDIAREAHVAKGSVYVHFTNKADLLVHCMAAEKLRLAHRFAPVFSAELGHAERLRKYIELAFEAVPQMPLIASLLRGDTEIFTILSDLAPSLREQIERQSLEALDILLSGIGRYDALSPEEREARCRALYALLTSALTSVSWPVRLGLEGARYARSVADLIVHGVGG